MNGWTRVVQVEAENLPEVAGKYQVTAVPFFVSILVCAHSLDGSFSAHAHA